MASSLEALEALLQFREGVPKKIDVTHVRSHCVRPVAPVPNPLDPAQPHVIEGDSPTPTPASSRLPFRSEANGAASSGPGMSPVVAAVPNPLLAPLAERPMRHPAPAPVSAVGTLAPPTAPNRILNHGFVVTDATPMSATSSSDAKPIRAREVEVRSDKIRDALNSKPQRGKKRHNLSELERLELTRTRNREHAKSTRMKKKARLEELVDIEKKYLLLKEKQLLDHTRRDHLVHFVESAGIKSAQREIEDNAVSSKLIELASEEIANPQFTALDGVALTAENSGMVRVSAHGTDLESGGPKTLTGVICVDFAPGAADICAALLFWSSPGSVPSSVGIFPSVSVLSFSP